MIGNLGEYLKKLKAQYDDDSIDRLNYITTVIILLVFAITIGAKQYVGKPLQCWVPAQFKGGWEQYVENYCFVENTYFVPMDQRVPLDVGQREKREINYYQWVPFVLALQALLFYVPRLVWKMINGAGGLNITALVNSATAIEKKDGKRKVKTSDDIKASANLVADHYRMASRLRNAHYLRRGEGDSTMKTLARTFSKGWGVYLTVTYLVIKILFLFNVVCQFLILNRFLGPKYKWWGFDILKDLANGIEWETSGHFPRVTLCDFVVRRLANRHRWTVQCVLMINMFNEKIYIFLWFWFLIVGVVSAFNFLMWIYGICMPFSRRSFIKRYMVYNKINTKKEGGDNVKEFMDKCINIDGVLVLKLIAANAGDIVTAQVVKHLWQLHNNIHEPKEEKKDNKEKKED